MFSLFIQSLKLTGRKTIADTADRSENAAEATVQGKNIQGLFIDPVKQFIRIHTLTHPQHNVPAIRSINSFEGAFRSSLETAVMS